MARDTKPSREHRCRSRNKVVTVTSVPRRAMLHLQLRLYFDPLHTLPRTVAAARLHLVLPAPRAPQHVVCVGRGIGLVLEQVTEVLGRQRVHLHRIK